MIGMIKLDCSTLCNVVWWSPAISSITFLSSHSYSHNTVYSRNTAPPILQIKAYCFPIFLSLIRCWLAVFSLRWWTGLSAVVCLTSWYDWPPSLDQSTQHHHPPPPPRQLFWEPSKPKASEGKFTWTERTPVQLWTATSYSQPYHWSFSFLKFRHSTFINR